MAAASASPGQAARAVPAWAAWKALASGSRPVEVGGQPRVVRAGVEVGQVPGRQAGPAASAAGGGAVARGGRGGKSRGWNRHGVSCVRAAGRHWHIDRAAARDRAVAGVTGRGSVGGRMEPGNAAVRLDQPAVMMLDLARAPAGPADAAPLAATRRLAAGSPGASSPTAVVAVSRPACAPRGIAPGDRVLLVSENRPEFLIADTAIMAIGAVTVPTYTTNTAGRPRPYPARFRGAGGDRLHRRAGRAGASKAAALAAGARPAGRHGRRGARRPARRCPGPRLEATPGDLATADGRGRADPRRAARLPDLHLRHRRRAQGGDAAAPRHAVEPRGRARSWRSGCTRGERYLSFLPLSHSYEHTVGGFLLPSLGVEVVYSRGADRLAQEFQDIKPAIVTAVPRLFEVLRAPHAGAGREGGRLEGEAVPPRPGARPAAAGRAAARAARAGCRTRCWTGWCATRCGRASAGGWRRMVSGGARLDPDLSGFFLALGLPVIQGYGQTEAGPVISVQPALGQPAPRRSARRCPASRCASPRMASCWCSGDLVMDGYWNQPEATAQALRRRPSGMATALAAHRRHRRRSRTAASASPTASATSSRRWAATWSAPPSSKAC